MATGRTAPATQPVKAEVAQKALDLLKQQTRKFLPAFMPDSLAQKLVDDMLHDPDWIDAMLAHLAAS